MSTIPPSRIRRVNRWKRKDTAAFTRVELLAVLVTLLVLLTLCFPLLGQNRGLSERAMCANNLRAIGLAFASWGSDYNDQRPIQIPVAMGGSKVASKPSSAYSEYRVLAAHLATPMVLTCPSDSRVKPARLWSTSSSGGFYNPAYQNNSVSYFVGLDADASFADSFLAGDIDLRVLTPSATCYASGVNNAVILADRGPILVAAWTNRVHTAAGNILFNDGRVETLSTSELRTATARTLNDQGESHIILPR